MRRRRQKNPLLMRIIWVSVLIHLIALPILAHFGAFKKIQHEFLQTQMVVLPPPSVDKRKEVTRQVVHHVARAHASASSRARAAGRAGPPHVRVAVASGAEGGDDDSGPTIDEGSGKAGVLPTAPTATSTGNGGGGGASATPGAAVSHAAPPPVTVKPSPAKPVITAPPPSQSPPPVVSKDPVYADAVPTSAPQPSIPDDLRSEAIDKTCVAEFTVGPDGTPTDVKILQSSGNDELDRLALECARKWRFKPATKDGQPIESRVRLHVEFQVS